MEAYLRHHENDKHMYEREEYLESRHRVLIDADRYECDYRSERGQIWKRLSMSLYTPPRIRKHSPDFLDGHRLPRHVEEERSGIKKVVEKEPASGFRTRGYQIFISMTLKKESALRMERRDREAERKITTKRRVEFGQRPHFVDVNEEGKPYGLGISVWNDALCKVVRGLDPFYIDIRQQPFHLMETLMQRLNDDFEYSNDVNPKWLRMRIGNALSSYRHELMKLIQSKQESPKWVDNAVWNRLVKIAGSDKFHAKSEQMRYANSCRKTKGRTGPLGEARVAEKLRQVLGRSPAPEEVHEEMNCDNGYSERVKRRQLSSDTDIVTEVAAASHDIVLSNNEDSPFEIMEGDLEETSKYLVTNIAQDGVDSPQVALDTLPCSAKDLDTLLASLLWKQIEELCWSEVSTTKEGTLVIHALENQLQEVRSRILRENSPRLSNPKVRYIKNSSMNELCPAQNENMSAEVSTCQI